jgi:hypothetical protein
MALENQPEVPPSFVSELPEADTLIVFQEEAGVSEANVLW